MAIDKKITEDDLIKAKMKADFLRKYEEAKDKGFKGDLEDFIRKIKYLGLAYSKGGRVGMLNLAKGGRIKDPTFNIYRKGGPVKPIQNGQTTLTSDDWDLIINSTDFPYELFEDPDWMKRSKLKTKPKKLYAKENPKPTFPQSAEEFIEMSNFLEQIKPVKPKKVAYKYGATSQSEEDLIGSHIDEWTNLIDKGELDPSTSFMKYLDMILGRKGVNRGGIVSVVPTMIQ